MAADFWIKRRDQLPEIVAILKDATGAVINLSGCTVRFIMTSKADGTTAVDEPATVVDAVNGKVKYSWAAGDTDLGGSFNAEFEVEFGSGLFETFPNSKNLTIKITDDLGGVST